MRRRCLVKPAHVRLRGDCTFVGSGGVVCYVAVMVLFVAAFKRGGSLTVLYPIYASTFIWAALIASRVYGTPVTLTNVVGMGFLIVGMFLLGKQG